MSSSSSPARKKARTPVSTAGRSVVDFVDDSELREALQTVTPQGIATNDWILPVPDPEAEEQSVEGELARLRTLQSYFLLDAEPDPAFDALTQEASRIFGVPTSLISLVDLGRQYLFSNTGANGVRETARDVAFCSHTILNQSDNGVLVVPDTTLDARFQDNPLVTDAPNLRFYAGASLISPEGHRLGTFCVEGPEPRPFSDSDTHKLKDYAATAMELMVQRRKELRDRLGGGNANSNNNNHWLRHASVTTNLGDAMFSHGDSITAMQLFQESVQTILRHAPPAGTEPQDQDKDTKKKEDGDDKPTPQDEERHTKMVDLLRDLLHTTKSDEASSSSKTDQKKQVMALVKDLFAESSKTSSSSSSDAPVSSGASHVSTSSSTTGYTGLHPHSGIPGLFNTVTKLKGVSAPRPLPPLVFDEAFTIDMTGTQEEAACCAGPVPFPVDERPWTVSMGECSKATLFNMGLIHYHWCRPDTALQFFHLAASVSHKFSPLNFDPVDLCSVNNMAQIHLLLRKPEEALSMLQETLKRGNATLAALYKSIEQKQQQQQQSTAATTSTTTEPASQASADATNKNGLKTTDTTEEAKEEEDPEALAQLMVEEDNDEAARKTRRLRRKLARTLLDIGHVHFFNNDLDKALSSCREAITLVDDHMPGITLAAAWYNLSLVLHHQGHNSEALSCLENFGHVARTNQLIDKDHVQFGDASQLKGAMLFDMGHYQECVEALNEALRIRRLQFGSSSGILVETLGLLGKAYLAQDDHVDLAIQALTECIEIENKTNSSTTTTVNANGKRSAAAEAHTSLSLEAAQTMLDLGRAYQIKGDLSASQAQYEQVHDWAKAFFGTQHAFPTRIGTLLEKLRSEAPASAAGAGAPLVAH